MTPRSPSALIIEDDLSLSALFGEILGLTGLQIDLVRDGQDALDRLAEGVWDIIVLDMHLPRVSGGEILTAVRADPRLNGTRVVVLTADPRMGSFYEDRADLVLIKPVSLDQLTGLVDRLVKPPVEAQPASLVLAPTANDAEGAAETGVALATDGSEPGMMDTSYEARAEVDNTLAQMH